MQKKLIALAIAGLSGAAFAQSNVTISGQMRVGIDSVSAGGCQAVGCANLTSRSRVVDNNSNIRFAGEEKLGNGMTAWFQVESALGTSDNIGTTAGQAPGVATTATSVTGTNSATLGTRNTAVGLKGNWGNFLIGKWDQHYSSHAGVDANGLAAHSLALTTNSLSILHSNNGANGAGGRFNNVLMYTTPNFSGFDMNIGYSTTAAGNETTAAATDKENNVFLNPRYTNGPIHVFYSYLKRNDVGNLAAGTSPDAKFNRFGGAYTFPMGFKLGLIWDKNSATTAAGVETKRSAWALPLSYTTGAHAFTFTYAKAGNSNRGGSDGAGADSGAKMTMLGYGYSMSKRTSVGVSWWSINNDSFATYDGWHPSSSVGQGAAIPRGSDPRTFSVNLNHTF